jgi:hypothetical protein
MTLFTGGAWETNIRLRGKAENQKFSAFLESIHFFEKEVTLLHQMMEIEMSKNELQRKLTESKPM